MPEEFANAPSAPRQAFTNRLIDSTSPYLLQHAHNPVDWFPWGPEAVQRAKAENRPIFLSIGYSACHWCHVMEREVFENASIAELMNQNFVNIKVDREERPDLDEIYMLATQLTTGQGGWPMSVWLTPELEPFYAGTYFPPVDGMGRPGFPRVILALMEAWRERNDQLRAQSKKIVEAVRDYADETQRASSGAVSLEGWLKSALVEQTERFDPQYGGLGTAPKFPPSQSLRLWVQLLGDPHGRAAVLPDGSSAAVPFGLSTGQTAPVGQMLYKTLDAMAAGGIYDQIGGAFARYSTDEKWLVPHFEKMTYDNAQLAVVYALAGKYGNRPDYARIARQTLDFYLREMSSDQGAFYSALDADSEGHEGKFYVWTPEQIRMVIPDSNDAELLMRHFGVTPEGNWESVNILHVAAPVETLARELGGEPESLQSRMDNLCEKLRVARQRRISPTLDDKILTGWNGLMISAFAIAGRVLKSSRYLEAAHNAMGFILSRHMAGGPGRILLRTSRNGIAHIPAYLEDYAFLINGLFDLIDATSPTSLPGTMTRRRVVELVDDMIRLFHDDAGGAFLNTQPAHERLFAKIKNAADNATPSPNAAAIRALFRCAKLTGRRQYRELAMRAVQGFAGAVTKQPSAFSTLLLALAEEIQFPETVVGRSSDPALQGPRTLVDSAHEGSPEVDLLIPIGNIAETGEGKAAAVLSLDQITLPMAAAGDLLEIPLTLHIAAGYHINTNRPEFTELYATTVRLKSDLPLEVTGWIFPEAHRIRAGNEWIGGYENTITIKAACTVPAHAVPGNYVIRATILAQPCSHHSCLPPERASIDIPIHIRKIMPA